MNQHQQITQVLSSDDVKRSLFRLAHEILEKNPNSSDIVLIGIQTRGVYLAKRLQKLLKEIESKDIALGTVDITLYRDDLTAIGPKPVIKETKIDLDLTDKIVVLVDDVLYTGRTVRAAIDVVMEFGRPQKIQLLALVDRGHRELPIRADFVGKNIPTCKDELVDVSLEESDKEDKVEVIKNLD